MKIAFAGKMGSGKTTYADHLVQQYGFKKLSFAHKVREATKALYDLKDEDMYGPNKPRELLQHVGQSLRTALHPHIWIDQLLHEVKPDGNYVVDDVRYPNEYEALVKNGFVMVRLEAPSQIRKNRLGNAYKNPDHPSETSLDGYEFSWMYTFNNSRSDEDNLRKNIEAIILGEEKTRRRMIR